MIDPEKIKRFIELVDKAMFTWEILVNERCDGDELRKEHKELTELGALLNELYPDADDDVC